MREDGSVCLYHNTYINLFFTGPISFLDIVYSRSQIIAHTF